LSFEERVSSRQAEKQNISNINNGGSFKNRNLMRAFIEACTPPPN
jgi:pantothenate kinase